MNTTMQSIENLIIGGKKIDMTRNQFHISTWSKLHEVGTNIIFGRKSFAGMTHIAWLLTPENSNPNPGLSKNMVIGGVCTDVRDLTQPLIKCLLHLQYGLGIEGYSSDTCALDKYGSSFVYVNKSGVIHEKSEDGGKFSRYGYSSETYGATVGQPCDYEIWFEHTSPEEDIYSVWQKEAMIGLSMVQEVFNRIENDIYVEDDHRFVATVIKALMSMGIPLESIETLLTKVDGCLEGSKSSEVEEIIEFINSLDF